MYSGIYLHNIVNAIWYIVTDGLVTIIRPLYIEIIYKHLYDFENIYRM